MLKRGLFRRAPVTSWSTIDVASEQGGTITLPLLTVRPTPRLSQYATLQYVKKALNKRYMSTALRTGARQSETKRVVSEKASAGHSSSDPRVLSLRFEPQHPIPVSVQDNKKGAFLSRLVNLAFVVGTVYIAYQLLQGKSSFLPETKPHLAEKPKVTFADVKGCKEVKEELEVLVKYLKDDSFGRLGAKIPAGILMVGPPGTGKTLLAKAVAGEADVPFYYAAGSSFDEMFVGVGEKRVRELFNEAKQNAPSIIFIDEIDAIAGRDSRLRSYRPTSTIHQLLAALDGFQGRERVVVLAATNHPEALDKALVRPGRFDKQISVPLPDVKGRKEILEYYLSKVKAAPDVRTDLIAKATVGFSGADLANLVNVAATKATLQGLDAVTTATIDEAKDDILLGPHTKSRVVHKLDVKVTAYHEAGHALVALHTPGATPPYKISILPRGRTGGTTQWIPEEDKDAVTKQELRARLATAMGGRIAEEMKFGPDSVTTGAVNDFEQATKIATMMVSKLGMSDKLGQFSFSEDGISPDGLRLVEEEAKKLLDEAYAHAKKVLREHEKELHMLAAGLEEYETMSKDEMIALLQGKEMPESFYKQYTRKKETDEKEQDSRIPLVKPALYNVK